MGGRPFVYPIFFPVIHGRAEQLCATLHTLSHTLRRRSLSLRLIHLIIDRFEPRASSSGTDPSLVHDAGGSGMVVYTRVYLGRHSREGGYLQGYTTRVVGRHIHRYTHPMYPLVYPPCYTTLCTPWVYPVIHHPGIP